MYKRQESRIWERKIQEARTKVLNINVSPWLYVATSLLMAGFLYTYYSTVGIYSTLVTTYLRYPLSFAALVLTVTNAIILFAHLGAGFFSDLVGRRLAFISLALASIVIGAPIYAFALRSIAMSSNALLITLALLGALVNSAYAIHAAYVTESYPTLRRGFGYGLSYAMGLIIGAFAPIILILMPIGIFAAIAVNAVIGQALILGVALSRPETKYLSMER